MIFGKKLAAGVDLREDETQLSYFIEGMDDPESVSTYVNEGRYIIPTIIAKTEQGWVVGEEAIEEQKKGNPFVYDGILKQALDGDIELLKNFIEECLRKIPNLELPEQLDGIDFTVPEIELHVNNCIFTCMEQLGVLSDKIHVIGYAESSIYYALSQKRNLWKNDVVFFDLSNKSFWYRHIHIAKGNKTELVLMEEQELTKQLNMEMLQTKEGIAEADRILLKLTQRLFEKKTICTVYLIGVGFFEEDWAEMTLKYLCRGRRVFKGRNLYTKGACYASYDRIAVHAFNAFCFLCSGTIPESLGIRIIDKEAEKTWILISAGTNWYDAKNRVECIVDETDQFELVAIPAGSKDEHVKRVSMKTLPQRAKRMSRVEISVEFYEQSRGRLQVSDIGFSNAFPGSGIILDEELIL